MEPLLSIQKPVVLYANDDRLFPNYAPRKCIENIQSQDRCVSLIAVLYNESESLPGWLDSLCQQERLPNEVIVVNSGSTDGSQEILEAFASTSPIPFQIIQTERLNIATGRNLAIQHARHPLIACTDLGVRMDPHWLKYMIAPFEDEPDMQVGAGWVQAQAPSWLPMRLINKDQHATHPQSYLPTSNTIVFLKSCWESIAGYPEWLTLTGEDTLFADALKHACPNWAFIPEAIVYWDAPQTVLDYWRKVRSWMRGNGEARYNINFIKRGLLRITLLILFTMAGWITLALLKPPLELDFLPIVIAGLFWLYLGLWLSYRGRIHLPHALMIELIAEINGIAGFQEGAKNRPVALQRKYSQVDEVIFVLTHVPPDDLGGGPRWSQITFELLRQGYTVFYFYKFPKVETIPLDMNLFHPNLTVNNLSEVNFSTFLGDHHAALQNKRIITLVEVPLKEYIIPIQHLHELGSTVLYELVDDWHTPLGGRWYRQEAEQRIISLSDMLIASERSLQERLENRSTRSVNLLPNAVNHRLFDPSQEYERPLDLPHSSWISIYIGSMWGDWFDWGLLIKLAYAYPQASVVVIGDYRNQLAEVPENLHFLGLKPQFTLPAYLAHADVALLPRKIQPATRSMSPLKVYEYLAMHKPVVTSDLPSIRGIPGVFIAHSQAEFIELVNSVRTIPFPIAEVNAYIQQNNWHARVQSILQLAKHDLES